MIFIKCMDSFCFLIIVHYLSQRCLAHNYQSERKSNSILTEGNFGKSRYNGHGQRRRNYGRSETDLPVRFEAPRFGAPDYWYRDHHETDPNNRKLFFEDHNALGQYEKKSNLPTIRDFYRFMSNLIGVGKAEYEPANYIPHNTPQPQFFQFPSGFRPTETTYKIPPKPIRASVIKLETITRAPIRHSLDDYHTTMNYFSPIGSEVHTRLAENIKTYYKHRIGFPQNRDQITPVLQKPVRVSVATENLPSGQFFNHTENHVRFIAPNPLIKFNDTRAFALSTGENDHSPSTTVIPGVVKIPLSDVMFPESPRFVYTHKVVFPPSEVSGSNISVSNIALVKHVGKMPNLRSRASVEKIANLTAYGLSSSEIDSLNVQAYINHANLKNLIKYEMTKFEKESQKDLQGALPKELNKSQRNYRNRVNLNDDLSLDARILKDTNWDGVTTTIGPTTPTNPKTFAQSFAVRTPGPEVRSTVESHQIYPQVEFESTIPIELRKVKDFWEINTDTTSTGQTEVGAGPPAAATEILPVITTQLNKTEISGGEVTCVKPEVTKNETAVEGITTQIALVATATPGSGQNTIESIQDVTLNSSSTTQTTPTMEEAMVPEFPVRKYRRRQKVFNLKRSRTTNKPKQSINHNHFQNRQKPNITLSIGKKNVVRTTENYAANEMMKFSDEDENNTTGRSKRRRLEYKHANNLTSEH